ncbi:MAG: hypothetical protein ACJ786_28600 [Catenulispora sp.]
MTRVFDRVLAKGSRITLYDMLEAARRIGTPSLVEMLEDSGLTTDPVKREWARTARPAGTGVRRDVWQSAKVIVADNVFRYVDELKVSVEELGAMLSTIAVVPPYERVVVEAQNLTDWYSGFAWLVVREDLPEGGWLMTASLLLEIGQGQPVGPIAMMEWRLDADGKYIQEGDGSALPSTQAAFPQIPEVPGLLEGVCEPTFYWAGKAMITLAMTFGLMHCKNVNENPHTPQPKQSTANQRRHGFPLTRYTTLDIRPVTRALDRDGKAHTDGLGAALHRCRGHFKTFRPEAPLFGRLSGQYWWNAHNRGRTEYGRVESVYRVHPPEPEQIGRLYVAAEAAEPQDVGERAAVPTPSKGRDPDLAGRGAKAHQGIQDLLAEQVAAAGRVPLGPRPTDPQFDLAWFTGQELTVVEVKSITDDNEVHQVRLAIGQVSEYAGVLQAVVATVRPVIALERPLTKNSLLAACARAGITVTWPGRFDDLFSAPVL